MKGVFFFKDELDRDVVIEEFDYDYVRNSLLKVYDRSNFNKTYKFNVIVKKDYDINGIPKFDVRELDLNNIFFNTTSLRVLELMKDDIIFNKINIRDISKPKLQAEYEDFLAGKVQLRVPALNPIVQEVQVKTRTEISKDDPRIKDITENYIQVDDSNGKLVINPMEVLDWIENFDICSIEMGKSTQMISDKQIQLVQVLKVNGDYINSVFDNLTSVLESIFPLKPSITQKIFGYKKDITVKESDLSDILRKLHKAVSIDSTKFDGVSETFKLILTELSDIKNTVENGIVGCKYAIANIDDPYEFELRQERLMKVRATNQISETALMNAHKKFVANINKLKEVQEVVIPLLIVKLQNQATSKVDESTVDIIRNLAYNRNIEVANDEVNNTDIGIEKKD